MCSSDLVQHFEDNVIDDAIEAKIIKCRIDGILERSQCFAGFSHLLEADMPPEDTWEKKMKNANTVKTSSSGKTTVEIGDKELGVPAAALDVANLMRIRFSLQQKMILLQTQERLERKRVDAVTTQQEILEALAEGSGVDDNTAANVKKETKKNNKKNAKKDGIVQKSEFDEDDENGALGDL